MLCDKCKEPIDKPKGRKQPGCTAVFEYWWKWLPGPMKKSKQLAKRHWDRIWSCWPHEERAMGQDLCDAIERQVRAEHFKGTDGLNRWPHGSSWLSDGRWDDEVEGRGHRQSSSAAPRPREEENRALTPEERQRRRGGRQC